MKDFEYYSTVAADYHSIFEIKRRMIAEINAKRMTADERDAATKAVAEAASGEETRLNQPYYYEKNRLEQEFWTDARADLGYADRWPQLVDMIQEKAYDRGHANGYAEIYHHLREIVEFVDKIVAAMEKSQ